VSGFLLRCIFNGLVLVCAVASLPGVFIDSLGTTVLGAAVLGLANAFIRPSLIMFSVPLESTVLGWTTVITNITLPTIAWRLLPGIQIQGLHAIIVIITGLSAGSYLLTRCIQDR
jgi:putative membrane protein